MRDIIKKLPKRRGYGKNRSRTVNPSTARPAVVNIAILERHFREGETVTPKSLVLKGVVAKEKGRIPKVKILGRREIGKKLTISGCSYSEKAREALLQSGAVLE
jgi:ribosomal protein L15